MASKEGPWPSPLSVLMRWIAFVPQAAYLEFVRDLSNAAGFGLKDK